MHKVHNCVTCGKFTHVFLVICESGDLSEWWLCEDHYRYWQNNTWNEGSLLSRCHLDNCNKKIALSMSRRLNGSESIPGELAGKIF